MADRIWPKFMASVLLHGMVLCGAAGLLSASTLMIRPVFQTGEFCLELGLSAGETEAAPAALAPASAELNIPPEPPQDLLLVDMEKPPPSQAPVASCGAGTPRPGIADGPHLAGALSPLYPAGARRRGEEGVVLVRVLVAPTGRASLAEIVSSSGYPALDQAAVSAARGAQFVCALHPSSSQDLETMLKFRFALVD